MVRVHKCYQTDMIADPSSPPVANGVRGGLVLKITHRELQPDAGTRESRNPADENYKLRGPDPNERSSNILKALREAVEEQQQSSNPAADAR
jgi:hypothetical protein